MKSVIERIRNEPVLVLNAIAGAFDLAVILGLDLDPAIEGGIVAVVTAVLNIVARSKVVPVRRLVRR